MSKKINIINNVLSFVITLALLVFTVMYCNDKFVSGDNGMQIVLFLAIGAVVAGVLSTLLHETGHLIAAKCKGFAVVSFAFLFFRWKRVKNKTVFEFILPREEAGSVELIAKTTEHLSSHFAAVTVAPLIATLVLTLVGVVPFFVPKLPFQVFCTWVMLLPIGAYSFLGNALPMKSGGVNNDGAVLLELKKDTASAKVLLSLMSIQSELFNGKTPGEIDEKLYFDLPQLPEDDLYFIMLSDARYNYYLDKQDYASAHSVCERLQTLVDYMPKSYSYAVKTSALYDACTFSYDEDVADDLTYELEDYLNNYNTATNLRVKLAYLMFVKKESEFFEQFYKKGKKEAKNSPIKGYGLFEAKLLDEMKNKTENI